MSVQTLQQIVVMGVSGSGKTTVGEALAAALGWRFVEGDSFHPAAYIAKMSVGIPLDDADRAPWLAALAAEIAADERSGRSSAIGCSALKRAYREILRTGAPRVRFLHIDGDRAVLSDRLGQRAGHFFPPQLRESQLAALEQLGPDEDGIVVDMAMPISEQVEAALRGLQLSGARQAPSPCRLQPGLGDSTDGGAQARAYFARAARPGEQTC